MRSGLEIDELEFRAAMRREEMGEGELKERKE